MTVPQQGLRRAQWPQKNSAPNTPRFPRQMPVFVVGEGALMTGGSGQGPKGSFTLTCITALISPPRPESKRENWRKTMHVMGVTDDRAMEGDEKREKEPV